MKCNTLESVLQISAWMVAIFYFFDSTMKNAIVRIESIDSGTIVIFLCHIRDGGLRLWTLNNF